MRNQSMIYHKYYNTHKKHFTVFYVNNLILLSQYFAQILILHNYMEQCGAWFCTILIFLFYEFNFYLIFIYFGKK